MDDKNKEQHQPGGIRLVLMYHQIRQIVVMKTLFLPIVSIHLQDQKRSDEDEENNPARVYCG